jgi:hypothetical protein
MDTELGSKRSKKSKKDKDSKKKKSSKHKKHKKHQKKRARHEEEYNKELNGSSSGSDNEKNILDRELSNDILHVS